MSHWTCYVLVPLKTFAEGSSSVEDYIANVLTPYDDSLEVEEHEEPCDECYDFYALRNGRTNKRRKPNPKCKKCHGSGVVLTTANPNREWETWEIGGIMGGFGKSEVPFILLSAFLKKNKRTPKDDPDKIPAAIVDLGGKWHGGLYLDTNYYATSWAKEFWDVCTSSSLDTVVYLCDMR